MHKALDGRMELGKESFAHLLLVFSQPGPSGGCSMVFSGSQHIAAKDKVHAMALQCWELPQQQIQLPHFPRPDTGRTPLVPCLALPSPYFPL